MLPSAFMGPLNFANVLISVWPVLVELVTAGNDAAPDNFLAAFLCVDDVAGLHLVAELPERKRRIAMGT